MKFVGNNGKAFKKEENFNYLSKLQHNLSIELAEASYHSYILLLSLTILLPTS